MSAAQYKTTVYDRLKGNDRGTHVYSPVHSAQSHTQIELVIGESSVLRDVKPQWIVHGSCAQGDDGRWHVGDVLATSAQALHAAAPHVYEWTNGR